MTSTVEFLYISISYLNKYVAQYPPETVVSCKLTVSVLVSTTYLYFDEYQT